MKAVIFFTTAFLLSAPMAFGQGGVQQSGVVAPGHLAIWGRNGVIMDGGQPSVVLSGPVLYATNPSYGGGVRPDGVTSSDAAMAAAVNACAAQGATLVLPPGQIKLTGTTTTTLRNCALVGTGVPAGSTTVPSLGTTILLTSTTVKPFLVQQNWSISGVNFYWPNQTTGSTAYPPLFSDDGVIYCFHANMDNVTIVNAYDGFKQTAGGTPAWGDIFISNSRMYAVHEMFNINSTGDSIKFSNTSFKPGAWLGMGGSNAAVGAGAHVTTAFHITGGAGVNISLTGVDFIGWRYGFLVDATGNVQESSIDAIWDTVGTIVDTSSGGIWYGGAIHGQNATCITPATVWGNPNGGNAPCFNLGSGTGTFVIDGFVSAGTAGSLVQTAGTNVIITATQNYSVGNALDGLDYAQVKVIGGAPIVRLQNNKFGGNASATNAQRDHAFGLLTGANVAVGIQIQNNEFASFTNPISMAAASQVTEITGNTSYTTRGTSSVVVTGTNPVSNSNNSWDKPLAPTVSSCGTSPTAAGFPSGSVTVGSGGSPVTSCSITLPFVSTGGVGGGCQFYNITRDLLGVSLSGIPPTWTLNFSGDMRTLPFWFNCPGVQ